MGKLQIKKKKKLPQETQILMWNQTDTQIQG